MTIDDIIEERGIQEVLHFTTNRGLAGVCASGYLKSRARLEDDEKLEYIFSPNAMFRKDSEWLDYVNLSIGEINHQFFDVASGRWHRGKNIWWCILSFDSSILTHEGVVFVTTNNMYSGARHAGGVEGLDALYADRIHHHSNEWCVRRDQHPSLPTCPQAEALYLERLSADHLQRIYFAKESDADEGQGQLCAFDLTGIKLVVEPERFTAD